ncbi:MAG: hypothetical protein E6Q97_08670 [Desulfurellales bacterium]|nr:MAG: hypothetical protein E6Q97_08670 [Desulfurellales bacterium]
MRQICTKKSLAFCLLVAVFFVGCSETDPLRKESTEALITARAGLVGFVEQWETWGKTWGEKIQSGEAAKMIEKSRDLKKIAETNPVEAIPAKRIEQLKEAIAKIDRELDRRER